MKNIYFYFLYFFGLVSIFLPAYENFWIASGIGQHITGKEKVSFLEQIIQTTNVTRFRLQEILSLILEVIILISILISIFFYWNNKLNMLFFLVIISLICLIINLINYNEMVLYGYYLLIFQQATLLILVIYTLKQKNKFI